MYVESHNNQDSPVLTTQDPNAATSSAATSSPSRNEILLAAAEQAIAEGYAIIPTHPNAKEPFACETNVQGYVKCWHNGVHSVYSASFGKPREYTEPKTGKKKKTTPALQAWWNGLDCNYAIALELSDKTALDVDEGIESEVELKEFLADFGIPATRAIRSGRTSSFGVHLLFAGAMGSGNFTIEWHGKTVKGEVKSRDKYVVGEGSFHKSGNQYTRLWDIPLAPTPEALFTDILAKYRPKKTVAAVPASTPSTFDGSATTQEQLEAFFEKNNEDFTYAGFHEAKQSHMYLRDGDDGGCPWASKHTNPCHDGDFAVFLSPEGKLSAKCQHESCKSEWTKPSGWLSYRAWLEAKTGKKIPLQPSGTITVGPKSKSGGVFPKTGGISEGIMSEMPDNHDTYDQDNHAALAMPSSIVYPLDVWEDTLYAEFADLCTKDNYIPREFFIEALKTVVGAIVGEKLSITNIKGGWARFFTLLMALPSGGKNTAIEAAMSLFEKDRRPQDKQDDFTGFGQCRLLWFPQEPQLPGVGACQTTISSASGLAHFLPSNKTGITQERLFLAYTELSTLLEKCGIEGSGNSLVSALCDLYDGTRFTVPALKDQKPFGGNLQLSILAGIQPKRWEDLGGGKGIENSGILGRWNIIPNQDKRRVSEIESPDLSCFEKKIRAHLGHATPLAADGSARKAMSDWYTSLTKTEPDVEMYQRLNTLAWRNALHHAFLLGKSSIDADSVIAGTRISDYQLAVRKDTMPLVGDTPLDKWINRIRRALRRKSMSLSELRDDVHYERSPNLFERTLDFLLRNGQVERKGKKLRLVKEGL